MFENNDDWLLNLKAEDIVAIAGTGLNGREYRLKKVKRLTKTMIILEDDSRFDKRGRYITQDRWHSTWLVPVTQEVKDSIEYQNLRYRTRSTLDQIINFINKNNATLEDLRDLSQHIKLSDLYTKVSKESVDI